MIGLCLATLMLAQSQNPSRVPGNSTVVPQSEPAQRQPAAAIDKAKLLSGTRRIYVEAFGIDPVSQQMQAMIISSLTESKRFTVTEDKDKADAILKGVAAEKTSQEVHAYSSGTGVAAGRSAAAMRDSSVNTENTENAHASVRLVSHDGDVIWTTTQESNGARFKGASADVADKVAKQLTRDAEKADGQVALQANPKPQ